MEKKYLEEEIYQNKLSRKQIALKNKCSISSVNYYIMKYAIKIEQKPIKENLLNKKFGTLLVIEKKNNQSWNCKCDCGKIDTKNHYRLINGKSECLKCSKDTKGKSKKILKKDLKKLYIKEDKNVKEICDILNISRTTFYILLKKFSIKKKRKNHEINKKINGFSVKEKLSKGKYIFVCDCGYTFVSTHYRINNLKNDKCVKCRKFKYEEIFGVIPRSYWNTLINGAEHRNIEFLITAKEASDIFTGYCSLTGRKIDFLSIKNGILEQTASLDRINSSKGYIKENIQWVHKDINKLKSDFNQDYFLKIIKEIYLFNLDKF